MKSDLSSVKVGDKIWTIQEGWTEVENITGSIYPIKVGKYSYTLDGKKQLGYKHPSAFLINPFEITREIEEEILISFREYELKIWGDSMTYAFVKMYLDQKYKKIPTAEEAAQKLGITVEQLKEIVK